jgi:hypothetical protein
MSLRSETDGAHLRARPAAASTAEAETSAVPSRAGIDNASIQYLREIMLMCSLHHRDQNRMPRTFVLIPDTDFSITEWLKNPTGGMGFDILGTQKNFKLIFFCPIGFHWVRDRYHVISLPVDFLSLTHSSLSHSSHPLTLPSLSQSLCRL